MPNEVTYVDEGTQTKAMRAMFGNGDLDFDQVLGILERLNSAGIILREPVESKPRGPRTRAQVEQDNADAAEKRLLDGTVTSPNGLTEASEANLPTVD